MKSILFVSAFITVCSYLLAQDIKKDKGEFIEYSNDYYNEILEEIGKEKKEPKKAFKMDLSEYNIPQSISEFKTVWCNEPLSQGNTGTCWCFSTSSFFESEIYRKTKKQVKLSEPYTVYWEYVEKARAFIKTKGESFFGEGSETNAVARMMQNYGVVPAEAYTGKKENQKFHNHGGMYEEMKDYLDSLKTKNEWNEEGAIQNIRTILNTHMGAVPEKIKVDGKMMTPKEYMAKVAQIKPEEYVNFMSLMEHPYYTKAEYDVPDNWWNSTDYYNVPLNDFMNIIKNALKNGYSISIGGDVSESGLNPMMDVAMVPSYDIPSDYIDENARQLRFLNGSTTDDHAIHLVGYKESPEGWWFLIKDSGSSAHNGKNKGYYFYHEDYVKLKMMTITLHKNAVPAEIMKQFN